MLVYQRVSWTRLVTTLFHSEVIKDSFWRLVKPKKRRSKKKVQNHAWYWDNQCTGTLSLRLTGWNGSTKATSMCFKIKRQTYLKICYKKKLPKCTGGKENQQSMCRFLSWKIGPLHKNQKLQGPKTGNHWTTACSGHGVPRTHELIGRPFVSEC